MHTAANQPSENASATKPANAKTAEEVLAQLKTIYRIKRLESEVTMVAAQTRALETLMACMMSIKSTGDAKLDAFYARERNRQRLAAIQTLLHIRTVQREKRLRRTMRAKAKAKAKAERLEPNRASDGSQDPPKGAMVGAEGAGHADNGSTVPSPLAGEGGRASGRMRGRSETSDQPNNTTRGGAAAPSPQPSPARGEGADPPSPLAGEGGRASGRMKGRSESSDHSRSRDHAQTSLSTPPEYPPPRKRSRYKTRKPKRPKQPARRKR